MAETRYDNLNLDRDNGDPDLVDGVAIKESSILYSGDVYVPDLKDFLD